MNNNLQLFKNELFGELPVIIIDGVEWFGATEAAKALSFTDPHKAINNHVDEDDSTVHPVIDSLGRTQNKKFINESGLYSLIFGAAKQGNNPEIQQRAKQFKHWVTREVLPTIRKTGGYINNADLMVSTYFGLLDDSSKAMIKGLLINIETQQKENQKLKKEIEYKEDVIIGLVDKISLSEKRQVLNRVVRKAGKNFQHRWNELYKQFELKYHINLSKRMDTYNENNKPKVKNKLEYIDKVLNKIPELYEIACKLYENDVKQLVQEMYDLNSAS